MVLDSLPEIVLLHKVSLFYSLCHFASLHKLIYTILYDDVIFDLDRAVIHNRIDIIFVQFDNLISPTNKHKVCPPHFLRIRALCRLLHPFVVIKLPVYPNCSIVLKNVKLPSEVIDQVATVW